MYRPFRLVFAGTPEFAVPHLRACLAENVEIAAVYTQPDRPAGRGRAMAASPVKQAALAAGLTVEQPESLKSPEAQSRLRELAPDLLVVVAYGLILPRKVLAIPRLGCWNVHASLLPRWRGAAPIQRAILAGDTQTGVCLMRMEAGLDTGPVLLRREIGISTNDTGGSLHDKLAALGAQVLGDGLRRTLSGEVLDAEQQPETGVTYAHKLDKSEARLDWNESSVALERKVRAFDPWPVAEADVSGERVRVWAAQALAGTGMSPGAIVAAGKQGIDVACGEGALRILRLQRAGGRVVSAADYLNARPELKRA
ncbi:MAG: methionyl-tRNA formyltransferase [Xanthomonadales bacterium PRO7]|jgi:methionyl-tRNA formyltransferase|nr:methionyl-tRNA formyltransferase [Xanthomonadales bacterium PRO7]HMM56021.1 methionyl-tRNA formyltransferase [Rudaea sp.]